MARAFSARIERDGDAYALLERAYFLAYGRPMPCVKKTDSGKPYFEPAGCARFSISHSRGMALVVFADGACGCDVERRDRKLDRCIGRVAEAEELRHFSPIELWTLKESYVKLVGDIPGGDPYALMKRSVFGRRGGLIVTPREGAGASLVDLGDWCAAVVCACEEPPRTVDCLELTDAWGGPSRL